MATKRRWVEIHRLTISGLEEGTEYGAFLKEARQDIASLSNAIWDHGEKSHALNEVSVVGQTIRMRFLSYTTGHRPDILDTAGFSITPNPLAETQTGVEWTHVLGKRVNGRYLLLCEKFQAGIWPATVGQYLQWMIDRVHGQEWTHDEDEDNQNILVSLEAEPGSQFLARIEGLTRIRQATVRKVRPNPGWRDLDTTLGEEADESKAHTADVIMTAPRKASLAKNNGIVQAIKTLFSSKELDYAAVEGDRDGQQDHFNSKKLVERKKISFRLDSGGQVDPMDAWAKLEKLMEERD